MPQEYSCDKGDTAFVLVARNERARQIWRHPHNKPRWGLLSKDVQGQSTSSGKTPETNDQQLELKKKTKGDSALRFVFDEKPKDYTKGFLLGSDRQSCDVFLGSSDTGINPQMLEFTFNQRHELIMNDTSIQATTVQFNDQLPAKRNRYSWVFPLGQELIRVTVGEDVKCDLVFDVVLPELDKEGITKYNENCKPFIVPGTRERLIAESLFGSTEGSGVSNPESAFYLEGKEIGSGSFGRVHKALRMPDGKVFAAKVPLKPKFWWKATRKSENEEKFKHEVDVLKSLSKPPHDNIVQFVDEWYGDRTQSMILDFAPGGTLQKRLAQLPPVEMEPGEAINISQQLLKALDFIHDHGVVHQDVKPGNILRKSQNHYMLADFGCAGPIGPVLGGQGTMRYMAPESDRNKPYSFEADVWSVGVVILACFDGLPTGDAKLRGEWCKGLRQKILDYDSLHKKHSDKKPEIKQQAIYLMHVVREYMLQLNPKERLSAKDLLVRYSDLWEKGVRYSDLWEQGLVGATSRIKEVGEQFTLGAPSPIEESEDFEVETPPSVGRVYAPALVFENTQVHIPAVPNANQESHYHPSANNAPANEAPAVHEPTKFPLNGPSIPEGEANAPSLPSVGEKRKRRDRSSATDDGENEATAPDRRPTADLDSPANNDQPMSRGDPSKKEVKRLRKEQSGGGTAPSEGH